MVDEPTLAMVSNPKKTQILLELGLGENTWRKIKGIGDTAGRKTQSCSKQRMQI